MVSTQLQQKVEKIEIIVSEDDPDFSQTGLKKDSLIRTTRVAVVDKSIFEGKLGRLPEPTFSTIKQKFASWILE
jgi:mRNA interferase MazF